MLTETMGGPVSESVCMYKCLCHWGVYTCKCTCVNTQPLSVACVSGLCLRVCECPSQGLAATPSQPSPAPRGHTLHNTSALCLPPASPWAIPHAASLPRAPVPYTHICNFVYHGSSSV